MFKKLLGNKLILEKVEEEKPKEQKTASGLYIPPSQNQHQSMHGQGKAVQVGPECEVVEEGDTVMYDRMAIRPIEIDGKEYILLNEESVVGVI